jgi:hypothetical protein
MSAQREDIVHDLYLRASSAAKPTAPLKLHANVTGKFFVKKQLDQSDIAKRMRESKAQANQAKQDNKIVYVDSPPVQTTSNPKKRKTPASTPMFRNNNNNKPLPDSLRQPPAPATQRKPSPNPPASNIASTSASVSSSSTAAAKAEPHPARMRLIHCLAISPRSSDEVVKLVGGPGCPPDKRADLLNLLSDVAEPVDLKSSGGQWQLRQRSWLEVRPYEWPKLTEQDRLNMCRQARMAMAGLKIPQSDPAWSAIKWRQTDKPANAPPISDSSSPARRGITSKEAKEKKAKLPKPAAAAASTSATTKERSETRSREENTRTPISVSASASTSSTASKPAHRPSPLNLSQVKDSGDSDRASLASPLSATSAQRRAPGSGYRATNRPSTPVLSQPVATSSSTSSANAEARLKHAALPPKPAVPLPPQARSVTSSRTSAEKDISSRAMAAERDREKQEKEERSKERQKERDRIEKERERDKEKEREKAERDRQREKEKEREDERARRERQRQQQDAEKERKRKEVAIPTKRKKVEDDENDDDDNDDKPLRKKRIPESSSAATSITSEKKQPPSQAISSAKAKAQRDHAASLKAKAIKRESSPPPPLPPPKQAPSTNGKTKTSSATSASDRSARSRNIPIYTSSEDEGEIKPSPPSSPHRPPPPSLPKSAKISKINGYKHRPPLPKDGDALRARYSATYTEFIPVFADLVKQKRLLERLLQGEEPGEDEVVLSEGELHRLTDQHNVLKGELDAIMNVKKTQLKA